MQSRSLLLSLSTVALVGLTACMSVTPEPVERPTAPRVTPAGDRSPLPGRSRPTPVTAHGKTSDATPPAGPERAREGSAPPAAKGRATVQDPAALPPRGVPPLPAGPGSPVPRPALPAVPKTGAEGEMKELCDASSGITAPGVTGLCRGAYG
ncbi:hypothetical protein ABZ348_28180 [Streptomyces sp. NPDC005963]|uniref:hypothetical protein n=1 Tax=Streptomyces sp. NPDC005963 TaxID=3156721 RepID=UPI0033EFDAB2